MHARAGGAAAATHGRPRAPRDRCLEVMRRFSGISFRKGCLSLLGSLNVPAYRLADHADHGTVDSSRAYTVDTVNDRAANSDLIGSAFVLGG